MMDDMVDGVDRSIIRKCISEPPIPLTKEEQERRHHSNGLLYRVTKSWETDEAAVRAIVAVQTMTDLQKLVPQMVEAFQKLVAVEENRERREHDLHAAELAAKAARVEGIWGKQGLVLGLVGVLATLAAALAGYLAGGA